MRSFVLFVVATCASIAQGFDPWPNLSKLLELRAEQLVAIAEHEGIYKGIQSEVYAERTLLSRELYEETARSPLRPAELGRLQVQWEITRRRLASAEQTANIKARSVLSESQLAKLKLLEEFSAMRKAMDEAIESGLSASDCLKTSSERCRPTLMPLINDIPSWGERPSDRDSLTPGALGVYTPLQAYFGFTASQWSAMNLAADRVPLARLRAVLAEIREETAKPELDAMALGVRYAEVESIRRLISENQARLIAQRLSVLTPAQREKQAALADALRLRPFVDAAVDASLLQPRCREYPYTVFDPLLTSNFVLIVPGTLMFLGDCPDRRALHELP